MAQRGGSGSRGGSGDDGYDWVYGGRGASSNGGGGGDDAEPTQVLPVAGGSRRPSGGAGRDAPPPSIAREPRRERPRRAGFLRRRRRRKGGPLRWLKWVLLAWLVFLVAVPLWAYFDVTKVDAEPNGQRPEDEGGTNYLVVGSDERPGLAGRRTDTIMLLHTGKGPNVLMSIPRDSLVEIPDRGTTKINAAFAFGGPKLLVRTVEQNTGIHVDDYVEIGFTGLVNLVDAVGGVTICPKEAINDPLAELRVKKGCQEADGDTALGYARTRKFSTGDIQRGQNQREVVSALGSEMLSWKTIVNPVRYYRVVTGGAESVRIGEQTGPLAVAKFGVAMNRVDGEAGMTCTVPIADFAVNWDQERSEQLFGFIQRNEADDIPAELCTPTGRPE
jgi:LCP family protein required for cell wall assembly